MLNKGQSLEKTIGKMEHSVFTVDITFIQSFHGSFKMFCDLSTTYAFKVDTWKCCLTLNRSIVEKSLWE